VAFCLSRHLCDKNDNHCKSKVTQSCPTLCDPMDWSLPGSSVHGIFQAIVLEWIAVTTVLHTNSMSSFEDSSNQKPLLVSKNDPKNSRQTACLQLVMHACVYVCAQSCPTLWDPMVYVVAIFYSRGFSWPKNLTLLSCVSCIAGRLFTTEPPVTSLFHLFSSVQFSRWVMSDSLRSHEPQHSRPPCPSPTPEVHPNPCPLSQWCHANISSSVVPLFSCPQSFPASGSFQMSQFFSSGGRNMGVWASTSVLPKNNQDWSHLAWTGWIPLQSKGVSRVFSNTTVQKHHIFGTQLSL